jgi:hypothetical protein
MRINKVAPVSPVVRIQPKIPYAGGDSLMDWHKEKTKSSVNEAFKDADYATPIWKCETDFEQGIRFLSGMVYGFVMVALALAIPVLFVVWLIK